MRERVEQLDHTVLAWLNRHATPWLDQRAVEVTALGDGYVATVLVIALGALLWLYGARVYAAALAAAALGAGLLTPLLKNTFERPRPVRFEVRGYFEETSYAYPSGHALLSAAILFTFAYIVHHIAARRPVSALVALLAGCAILLTAWSRIYLNVHHPSDVVAGIAIGVAWGMLCCAWAERVRMHLGESIHRSGAIIDPPTMHDRKRMTRPALVMSAVLAAIAACGVQLPARAQELLPPAAPAVAAAAPCEVVRPAAPLPEEVRETSGLARGSNGWWTHNDAGSDPVLYRLAEDGTIAQRVTVAGVGAEDWEDVESAPCDGGLCLFIANIGDNDAERAQISVYRIAEPPADATEARGQALHLTYPDGARDAEALFVDSTGTVHIVTKGRREQITLYRAPADAWQRGSARLEAVRVLFPRPRGEPDRVTSATTTPDGRWAAVRTYATLYLFPLPALTTARDVAPVAYDLRAFGEEQGESIVMDDDGTVRMSSEAESRRSLPAWTTLRCPLPQR